MRVLLGPIATRLERTGIDVRDVYARMLDDEDFGRDVHERLLAARVRTWLDRQARPGLLF